jgi:Na+/H+-dicarboxylate symporter
MTEPENSSFDDDQVPLPEVQDEPESRPGGLPLYVWVILAVVAAIPVGIFWGEGATSLEVMPKLILRALTALAAPLVVLAILSAIVTNEVRGRVGALMMVFYLINTLVAMLIGLTLSNLIRPGLGASLVEPGSATPVLAKKSATELIMDVIPKSIGEPFTQNHLAQLVVLTLALGIGLVKIRDSQKARGETSFRVVVDLLTIGFELLMKVLLWVVALVPLAVFGIVAASVGQKEGMRVFASLIWLIVVVILGLAIQVVWYLLQMWLVARMSPLRFLRGSLNVMANTISTASTAATIPITLRALERLGISRRSSQLTACIGTNFNNDGTALYQATAVLFMAQALGYQLTIADQVIVMLTTLVASVGAGGIPSGSFVTMPLIFAAVRLPVDKIPILLTVDWLLDRCRTTSNVLGDMTVAVLLDRVSPPSQGV